MIPEPERGDHRKGPSLKILWLILFYFFSGLSAFGAEEGSWLFLPREPLFNHLIGDPREDQSSLTARFGTPRLDGSIAATLEFLQWLPGDGTRWGWGIEGDSFIELEYWKYGLDTQIQKDNLLIFPERVSDWYLGTYLSGSSGPFSDRLEYRHVNSNLGDGFFNTLPGSTYSRESLRDTASFQLSEDFRLYTGLGCYLLSVPDEPPFYFQTGMELFSGPFPFVFGTFGRGYFTYDLQAKQEAGGILNQNFALGFQWRWEKDSHQAIRLGLVYFNGNDEYGQFYLQNDNHWSLGLFFDP